MFGLEYGILTFWIQDQSFKEISIKNFSLRISNILKKYVTACSAHYGR